jgi:hypothetical protein
MVECYCPKVKGELYYYYCGKTKDNVIQQAIDGYLTYDEIVRIGIVERRAPKIKERKITAANMPMRKRSRKKRKRTASA